MMVKDDFSIHDLLWIENDTAIADAVCPETGLPLWPHIRISLFRLIMADFLYGEFTSGATTSMSFMDKLTTLSRAVVHNFARKFAKHDPVQVCIVSDGLANQLMDGKWFNRTTDYFARINPRSTLTLEDHFEWKWHFPRYNERLMFLAPQRAMRAMLGFLWCRKHHRELAERLVVRANERAFERLGWRMTEAQLRKMSNDLALKIASMPKQFYSYEKFFRKTQPRVLLIGSASFGGLYAIMIAAARSMGVVTAEYQHGAVSLGHDGYNFSPLVVGSPAFRRILPDYFLSYGPWWQGEINIPVTKIPIGNPHRDGQLSQNKVPSRKDAVLILSDGSEFEKYLHLARTIENAAGSQGLSVIIRPHPLERTMVTAQYAGDPAVHIDRNADIYASLAKAKIVISEVSTVLFEAIGLADQIYMWNTHKARFAYPNHPFACFSSPEELAKLIGDMRHESRHINGLDFWAPDWRQKYAAFLSRCGITSDTP